MSLREYEDFFYARLPGRRPRAGHGLAAPVRRGQPADRVDRGQGGGAHPGPGHRHQAGRRGPHLDPLHRPAQHARRRVLHRARSRTRWRARWPSRSRPTYGGREVAGVRFRFEGGKVVDASAEQGEDFLIEMLDTDDGRAPPRRARHRHQLRHLDRHQGDPARREDRRDRAHGDRHELPGDRRRERLRRALGHGLRPAPGRLDHRGR